MEQRFKGEIAAVREEFRQEMEAKKDGLVRKIVRNLLGKMEVENDLSGSCYICILSEEELNERQPLTGKSYPIPSDTFISQIKLCFHDATFIGT